MQKEIYKLQGALEEARRERLPVPLEKYKRV